MGASTSKPAKAAAGAAARKYPSRPTRSSQKPSTGAPTNAPPTQPPAAQNSRPGPTVRPQARASGQRDEAINLDASDPDFARSLRSLGAVQPNPTLSPSSAFSPHPSSSSSSSSSPNPFSSAADRPLNPALRVLQARSQLSDEADREILEAGRQGHPGRRFLDVGTVRQVLVLRDGRGQRAEEIERRLGLAPGIVGRLGPMGVVGIEGIQDE